MEDKTREHMVEGSIWLRGLHMLVLAVGYNVVEAMLALTTIFQFFSALITGRVNEPLLQFAKNGGIYVQEVFEFLTFNSEIRPFPFTPWPNEAHTGDEWLDEDLDEDEGTQRDLHEQIDSLEDDAAVEDDKPRD